eukprot:365707-Chlamydomonas_euryale.AAC.6
MAAAVIAASSFALLEPQLPRHADKEQPLKGAGFLQQAAMLMYTCVLSKTTLPTHAGANWGGHGHLSASVTSCQDSCSLETCTQ